MLSLSFFNVGKFNFNLNLEFLKIGRVSSELAASACTVLNMNKHASYLCCFSLCACKGHFQTSSFQVALAASFLFSCSGRHDMFCKRGFKKRILNMPGNKNLTALPSLALAFLRLVTLPCRRRTASSRREVSDWLVLGVSICRSVRSDAPTLPVSRGNH